LEIEKRHFIKRKYGKELLIDCSLYSKSNGTLPEYPYIVDFYGIFIITNGEGSILLDNNIIPFSKGSVLFFQPNHVRQWQNVSSDFDGYFLIFENEFIETFFQDSFFIYRFQFFHNTTISYKLECKQDFLSSLIDFCKTINHELANLQEDSHHFLRSILYNILIQINRKYIEQYGLSVNLFQNNIGLQLKKLLEVKIRNYQRVEDYADFLKISRAHLNNISKKAFGLPVSIIIKERLLTEIKRELLFTNKSIKEISFEMNFSDVSNLIRFFKKHTGINPNEYKLKYTK
jgi:AraC family transcriptional regulator, transcriptional activator of pobA